MDELINQYLKLLDYIVNDKRDYLIKRVFSYQYIPYKQDYNKTKLILSEYKTDNFFELLIRLGSDFNYHGLSSYIAKSFYPKTLSGNINQSNYNYKFLNHVNSFNQYDDLLNLAQTLDYDKYSFLNKKYYNKNELTVDEKNYREYCRTVLYNLAEYVFYLDNKKKYKNVFWISRDFGDGFGFDFILNKDNLYTNKDNIYTFCEIKSSINCYSSFSLSQNEYNIFLEIADTANLFSNEELGYEIHQLNEISVYKNKYITNEYNSYIYDYSKSHFTYCGTEEEYNNDNFILKPDSNGKTYSLYIKK